MSYQMKWLIERRVIASRIDEELTTEDIGGFLEMFNAWLEHGNPPVHHIMEIASIGKAPVNLREVNKLVSFDKSRHGWAVIIGDEKMLNPLVRFIISAVLGAQRLPVRICKNFDEAWGFLLQADPSLQEEWNQSVEY